MRNDFYTFADTASLGYNISVATNNSEVPKEVRPHIKMVIWAMTQASLEGRQSIEVSYETARAVESYINHYVKGLMVG